MSIAVRYLRQPAAPDDLLKSIEAISGQARDDLEVLSDHLSWLGPASDLIAQNLQFVVQTVADARVLAPRTHEFWTFSRQQLMKRVVNNPTLVKMALANQAGPLLLVVLADAVGEPSLVQQACYLLNGKDVVVSIDNKRAILNAVLALESHWSLSTHMERIVRHIVDVSENSAMFIGICRQIPFADISNIVEFPFDVAGRELAANLAVAGLRRTLAEMGYSDMERGDIENALGRLNTGGLLQMLIRLHQVHRSQGYEHGMLLIKDMLWRLTQKQYDGYRYRHSAGATQLAFIHGGEFVWRENERLVPYCGDVKGLKPYIKTLRRVANRLSAEVSGFVAGRKLESRRCAEAL